MKSTLKLSRRRSPASASPNIGVLFGYAAVLTIGLTVVIALPAASHGLAQDAPPQKANVRAAKELEFLEGLLVENVQYAIQMSVQAINTASSEVEPEGDAADEGVVVPSVRITYMFRTSGETVARGMFLEDYGVVFTVQVPTLSSVPAARYYAAEAGIPPYIIGPDSMLAHSMATEIQVRTKMQMLERELAELANQLREQLATDTADEARQIEQLMAEIRAQYEDYAAKAEEETRRSAKAGEATEADRRRVEVGTPQPARRGEMGFSLAWDSAEQARAKKEAEGHRAEVQGAVVDAVIGTLAQYGHVFHGLEPDDRLAVVLLPSSYLNPIQRWMRATSRAEELTISISYGDLQALDSGEIDDAELGERVRIETRLSGARQNNGQE